MASRGSCVNVTRHPRDSLQDSRQAAGDQTRLPPAACHHVCVRSAALLALSLASALILAACGGSASRPAPGGATSGPASTKPTSRAADASAVRVIRSWSDSLRGGDVDRASRYFALPSVIQNGGSPVRLSTTAQVRAFNLLLPCGARLVRTEAAGRYTLAEFVLTQRTGVGGGKCDGTGAKGATAFRITRGKILEWRRIAGLPAPGTPPTEPPPLPAPRPAPAPPIHGTPA